MIKNWPALIICLVLSFGIWLFYNLSQENSDIVSVQVVAESNIDGRSQRSSDNAIISARCKASGFNLVRLPSQENKVEVVKFDPDDFTYKEGDYFTISANKLGKYTSKIFGDGVNVEQFLVDDVRFRFTEENSKKVPIKAVNTLGYKSQYTNTRDLELMPDSVAVYGTPEMLDGINTVYTKPLILNDIRGNIHGEVALESPSGLRLSDNQVEYNIEVSRYVEISTEVPVNAINVPAGVDFSVFPSSITATFRCVFPLIADPVESISCVVDYNEYLTSKNGACLIECLNIPSGVIETKLSPSVANCIEMEKLQ